MATEDATRASDSDRENTITALRGQYAEGRLTLEEFDERTSAAFAARTWADLRALTRDLPVRLGFGSTAPAEASPPAHRPVWRVTPLVPILLIATVVLVASWHDDGEHHFPFIPLAVAAAVLAWRWLRFRRWAAPGRDR